MTNAQAFNFLVVGLGMIASPAMWPEYFAAAQHFGSAVWLELMGSLLALGGSGVLGFAGVQLYHRLAAWEPLDFSLRLPDVGWAMPPSLFSPPEDREEILVALRLQRQLRRVA